MRQENIPEAAIDIFACYYRQLADNISIFIPESSITPATADDIEDTENIQRYSTAGIEALKKTAVIKLNGGLGTTMGLQSPKSLIKVKNGLLVSRNFHWSGQASEPLPWCCGSAYPDEQFLYRNRNPRGAFAVP